MSNPQIATIVWATPNGDELIAEIARVSTERRDAAKAMGIGERFRQFIIRALDIRSPSLDGMSASAFERSLTKKPADRLIAYLIRHRHWSPFEMVNLCVRVDTRLDVAAQILRHRSMSFQQFSQRYEDPRRLGKPRLTVARIESPTNRQSSTGVASPSVQWRWYILQRVAYAFTSTVYGIAIRIGIPREQARGFLPVATPTTLYINGSLRSWLHYLELRTAPDTQEEHRKVANAIAEIVAATYPMTWAAWQLVQKHTATV